MLKNKYSKWYKNLIEKARKRIPIEGEYYEKHHIKPRCLGGSNSKRNLVKLTAKEHYLSHVILCKCYVGKAKTKMIYAAWKICCVIPSRSYQTKIPSRIYEYVRKINSKYMSKLHTGNLYNLGSKRSLKSRRKMRKAQLGSKQSPETIEKRVSKLRNRKYTKHTHEPKLRMVYQVTTPTGEKIIIKNLAKFCREHKLSRANMCSVAHGYKWKKSVQGYTVIILEER